MSDEPGAYIYADLSGDERFQQNFKTNTHYDSSQDPNKRLLITKQPKSRAEIQVPFAFEWPVPENGTYGKLVDAAGICCGKIGLIPICCCFPNPYREVQQGYVGLVTKFGELYKSVDPGLIKINPYSEKLVTLNVMLKTMQIPTIACYTKDNVQVSLSSVVYYQIVEPHTAFFTVSDVDDTLKERTQTTLRQVIGARNLQDVIERREEIAQSIEEIISGPASSWGIKVESLLIKELSLPQTVAESLSMAAEAKRIGESKIIQAKAEVESAKLMRKAADILASKPAMQIRYLDAMQNMAKSAHSKVIFMPSQEAIENSAGAAAASAGEGSSNNHSGKHISTSDFTASDIAKISAVAEIDS